MGDSNGRGADQTLEILTDPVEAADAADLRYVEEGEPGVERKRWGRGFTYIGPDGERITGPDKRRRYEALAIPLAWTDVWICHDLNGHILATGRDDKGRKQYIYHPRWNEIRSQTKFNRMILFGHALPGIREQVDADLRRHGLPRERVLALVVRLLDLSLIRIGNDEYAQRNDAYGLTTMQDHHVTLSSRRVEFEFMGKSGKEHVVTVEDRRLARLVKMCQEIPGYELFQYYDDDGQRRDVGSGDVNAYLREITGEDFTAKDFRTWGGTVLALQCLLDLGPCETKVEVTANIGEAVRQVSEGLGNTPAVCRQYYIHPSVLSCYENGTLPEIVERARAEGTAAHERFSEAESAALALLTECAANEASG